MSMVRSEDYYTDRKAGRGKMVKAQVGESDGPRKIGGKMYEVCMKFSIRGRSISPCELNRVTVYCYRVYPSVV